MAKIDICWVGPIRVSVLVFFADHAFSPLMLYCKCQQPLHAKKTGSVLSVNIFIMYIYKRCNVSTLAVC